MKKPLKAAMLSLFVYPGAGHFLLKKHKMGILFMLLFSIPFGWLLVDMVEQTNQLLQTVIDNNLPLDVATLTDMFTTLSTTHTQTTNGKGLFMLVIWLLSTADAYRVGFFKYKQHNGQNKHQEKECS